MKAKIKNLLCTIILASFSLSCSSSTDDREEDNTTNQVSQNTVSDNLHLKFKTPDWERIIDCEQLDLYPFSINSQTFGVSATSASTNETFYFSYPRDSSAIVRTSNLKRYPIANYGENENPFEFSQKLPATAGSTQLLISSKEFSDNIYNEVVEIKHFISETNYSVFKVKCKYRMNTYVLNSPDTKKFVEGTFHFKIRTTKN